MLKVYTYKGRRYQFEEKDAPKGAVAVKAVQPSKNKARKPKEKK